MGPAVMRFSGVYEIIATDGVELQRSIRRVVIGGKAYNKEN